MQLPTIEDLLKAGIHFGHKTSKWHPSMGNFIFGERKDIHIIDLNKTLACMETAYSFIIEIVQKGKTILLIATKEQARTKAEEIARASHIPYVTNKWIGGTITNWPIIKKQILKLKKAREDKEKGEWAKYTKREQVLLQRELEKLEEMYGGLDTLDNVPDALFVLDCKTAKTALREANAKHIPIVALCDTNVNITNITWPIPGNDDATRSINLILDLLQQAVEKAREQKDGHVEEITTEQKKEETPSNTMSEPDQKSVDSNQITN